MEAFLPANIDKTRGRLDNLYHRQGMDGSYLALKAVAYIV